MNQGSPSTPKQDMLEANHIAALSRPSVVEAYAEWKQLTDAEALCFERFLRSDQRILDLGCGAGRFLAATGTMWLEYLGVDSSDAMISAARARFPNAVFKQEDMLKMEIRVRSYDAVLMLRNVIDMLHPVERRGAALRLAKHVLSEDGVLICSSHLARLGEPAGYVEEDYHGAIVSNYRSTISQWCCELESAGFNVLMMVQDDQGNGATDWTYAVAKPSGL